MLQINIENNEYVFLYCDGVDNNIVELSEDNLRGKQIIIFLEPNFCSIPTYGRRIIEQINKLIKMNGISNNIVLRPTPNSDKKFDFNKELNVEELLYKNYDNIKHPELISVMTLDYFATDMDKKMVPIYDVHPLPHCKDIDRKIELFAADIKNSSLSSFEKFLAAHIICTRFMDTDSEYEQDGVFINNPDLKNVYGSSMHILSDSDEGYKIKCGGYVDLFSRIMRKMNLSSKPMILSNIEGNFGHVVSLVDINDEKYGINDTFVCDLRSDSDSRAHVEAEERKDIRDSESYWGFNSLGYFCMNCDDFIALLGLNKFNSSVIYSFDLVNSYSDCENFISKERIPIDSIKKALGAVYRHMYSINDNFDDYLNGGVLDRMKLDVNREIDFVKKMREIADSNMSNSNVSELNDMIEENASNKNINNGNNGKNEQKK